MEGFEAMDVKMECADCKHFDEDHNYTTFIKQNGMVADPHCLKFDMHPTAARLRDCDNGRGGDVELAVEPIDEPTDHELRIEGDEYVCNRCGKRWGFDDTNLPLCD